jgi:hypothetical protein
MASLARSHGLVVNFVCFCKLPTLLDPIICLYLIHLKSGIIITSYNTEILNYLDSSVLTISEPIFTLSYLYKVSLDLVNLITLTK